MTARTGEGESPCQLDSVMSCCGRDSLLLNTCIFTRFGGFFSEDYTEFIMIVTVIK